MAVPLPPGLDLSQTPSGPPPPGVIPNFINPESNATLAVIVVSILLPLTLIFVGLRLYITFWLDRKKKRTYSDYSCIFAMMTSISFAAVMYLISSQRVFGRHIWDVPISANTNFSTQLFMVVALLYSPAIFAAKLTVLLLYLELFRVDRKTRIMTLIAIALLVAQCVASIVGLAILCVPLPGRSWELKNNASGCLVIADELTVGLGVITMLTDFFILLIPIPVIWKLQYSTRKKIGVSLIFFTGIFACLASILALYYRIRQLQDKDNTFNAGYTYMLCAVEINVTIICSCMPFFAPYTVKTLQTVGNRFYRISSRVGQYFRSSSSRVNNNSAGFRNLNPANVELDDKMRLTVGVSRKEGKFLDSNITMPKGNSQSIDESLETTRTEISAEV